MLHRFISKINTIFIIIKFALQPSRLSAIGTSYLVSFYDFSAVTVRRKNERLEPNPDLFKLQQFILSSSVKLYFEIPASRTD